MDPPNASQPTYHGEHSGPIRAHPLGHALHYPPHSTHAARSLTHPHVFHTLTHRTAGHSSSLTTTAHLTRTQSHLALTQRTSLLTSPESLTHTSPLKLSLTQLTSHPQTQLTSTHFTPTARSHRAHLTLSQLTLHSHAQLTSTHIHFTPPQTLIHTAHPSNSHKQSSPRTHKHSSPQHISYPHHGVTQLTSHSRSSLHRTLVSYAHSSRQTHTTHLAFTHTLTNTAHLKLFRLYPPTYCLQTVTPNVTTRSALAAKNPCLVSFQMCLTVPRLALFLSCDLIYY